MLCRFIANVDQIFPGKSRRAKESWGGLEMTLHCEMLKSQKNEVEAAVLKSLYQFIGFCNGFWQQGKKGNKPR